LKIFRNNNKSTTDKTDKHKNPDIPEIQQKQTLAKLHELLDASDNVELKKIKELM